MAQAAAVVADAPVLQRHGAALVAQPDPGTAALAMAGWRVAARKRPILSDQDKEGLSQRISRYWARKGKTAASMVVVPVSPAAAEGAVGAAAGAGGGDQNDSGSGGGGSGCHNHNFTPLPEILFGQSYLEVLHEASGLALRFNTAGALLRWARAHVPRGLGAPPLEVLRVPEASRWAAANLAAGLKQVQYDWVFGTDYQGELATVATTTAAPASASASTTASLSSSFDAAAGTRLEEVDGEDSAAGAGGGGAPRWEPAGPGVIDRGLLQATEQPILFYADVPLYEDELHDHGAVQLAAKIRVMPTCWFILLRYFLRVDGMLVRVRDTRLFHRFGSAEIGREVSRQEASFAQLRERGLPTEPSEYRDPNVAASRLGPPGDVVYSRLSLAPPS